MVGLLIVSFSVMEDDAVAFLDGLIGEASEGEVSFEVMLIIVGGDDHASFLHAGDGQTDGLEQRDQP